MRDNEGFRLVTRKKKRGSAVRNSRNSSVGLLDDTDDTDVDCEVVFRKLLDAEIELKNTSFAVNVFNGLRESLHALNVDTISEILCYGLGRFSRCKSSKYQLALLLSLKEHYGSRVYIYDPAFLAKEIDILRRFDFNVIEANEEGKRVVNDNVTLVYMPHCATHLINNFLYANWSQKLSNCILLTNSFSIVTENPGRNPASYVDYISFVRPYVTEIPLKNDFTHKEAFNDLNIHIFPERNIDKVPRNFWAPRGEPCYRDVETEFLTTKETEEIDSNNRRLRDES